MSINILDFQKDVIAKAKSANVKGMDWQDVAQELNLHLFQNIHKYNPSRGAGPRTFVVKLITNKLLDLVRATNAQKRYLDYNCISLDELISQELTPIYDYAQ